MAELINLCRDFWKHLNDLLYQLKTDPLSEDNQPNFIDQIVTK